MLKFILMSVKRRCMMAVNDRMTAMTEEEIQKWEIVLGKRPKKKDDKGKKTG